MSMIIVSGCIKINPELVYPLGLGLTGSPPYAETLFTALLTSCIATQHLSVNANRFRFRSRQSLEVYREWNETGSLEAILQLIKYTVFIRQPVISDTELRECWHATLECFELSSTNSIFMNCINFRFILYINTLHILVKTADHKTD